MAGKTLILIAAVLVVACGPQPTQTSLSLSGKDLKVIDMTHTISKDAPFWPSDEGIPYRYDTLFAHADGSPGMGRYHISEHFGTHLDAPVHSAKGQPSVDQLTPRQLMGPAVVVDVQSKCASNPDYVLTVADLQDWEKSFGEIPAGSIVLMNTGWNAKWSDMSAYRNQDAAGTMHFPGFSAEAATWLVTERNINGIGVDTFSVDAGAADGFPVHRIVNGAGKIHLENVADTDSLPASGAWLITAPIKLRGGSGGQVRVFGVLTGATLSK